jgi:hypothetical protein
MSRPVGQHVLEDAIKLIEDRRLWTTNALEKQVRIKPPGAGMFTMAQPATARCIDGAIIAASKKYGGEPAATLARNMFCAHLKLKPEAGSIHSWNDSSGRTHAQVLTAMRGALQAA